MRAEGRMPDAFVAGVGTGGTVMGVGRFLRQVCPSVRVHPLEPASSPTLSIGHKVGVHRIQGVSDEFVPPIVDLDFLDAVVSVDDGDAILMAQRLARDLGLGVGISSGANFLGAVKVQDELGPGAEVMTAVFLRTTVIARPFRTRPRPSEPYSRGTGWSAAFPSTSWPRWRLETAAASSPWRSTFAWVGPHPFLALRFLTGGDLDPQTGLFHSPSGLAKYYRSTDNLQSERYRGLLPEDLMEILTENQLHYGHRTETAARPPAPRRRR